MTKFSSKKQKNGQGFSNPIPVLLAATLLGTFAVFGPFNVSFFDSININSILPSFHLQNDASARTDVSFTSDQNYWQNNCNHGWASDATCDAIVSRIQSCLVNVASPYCSAYKSYMQEFLKQRQIPIAREISRP